MTDFIPAPALAKKLGLKTSTLARWRRSKTPIGPQGWIHYSATQVAYPVAEVERWETERKSASKQSAPEAFGSAAA